MSPRRMINETVAIRFVVFTGLCNTPLVYYAANRTTSLQARAWRPTLGISRLPGHKATPRASAKASTLSFPPLFHVVLHDSVASRSACYSPAMALVEHRRAGSWHQLGTKTRWNGWLFEGLQRVSPKESQQLRRALLGS